MTSLRELSTKPADRDVSGGVFFISVDDSEVNETEQQQPFWGRVVQFEMM